MNKCIAILALSVILKFSYVKSLALRASVGLVYLYSMHTVK